MAAGPWDESSLKDIREDTLDRKAAQYLDRDDMIGTVGFALLSTTIQCARCHDHKFDPIAQEEYYGLQAVFAGVDRANRAFDADGTRRSQRTHLAHRKAQLLENPNAAAAFLTDPALAAWEKVHQPGHDAWTTLNPDVFISKSGASPSKLPDHSVRFAGNRPEKDTYTLEAVAGLATIAAVRLEVLSDKTLPHGGPGRQDNGNFHLSEFKIEARQGNQTRPLAVAHAFADFNQAGWEIGKAIDGQLPTAWGIYPEVGKSHAAVFVLKEPLKCESGQLPDLHAGPAARGRPPDRTIASRGHRECVPGERATDPTPHPGGVGHASAGAVPA